MWKVGAPTTELFKGQLYREAYIKECVHVCLSLQHPKQELAHTIGLVFTDYETFPKC